MHKAGHRRITRPFGAKKLGVLTSQTTSIEIGSEPLWGRLRPRCASSVSRRYFWRPYRKGRQTNGLFKKDACLMIADVFCSLFVCLCRAGTISLEISQLISLQELRLQNNHLEGKQRATIGRAYEHRNSVTCTGRRFSFFSYPNIYPGSCSSLPDDPHVDTHCAKVGPRPLQTFRGIFCNLGGDTMPVLASARAICRPAEHTIVELEPLAWCVLACVH